MVKFDIYFDGEFWCARGWDADIFTQGETLDELMSNLREATELHFEESLDQGESLHLLILSEMEISRVPAIATG